MGLTIPLNFTNGKQMRISSNVPVNEADTWAVLTALSNKNKTLESLISSVFVSRKTFNQ